ncbi:hypothetical protein PFISCL1PPCAC_8516, partial [Pristionchus fissidentatus]
SPNFQQPQQMQQQQMQQVQPQHMQPRQNVMVGQRLPVNKQEETNWRVSLPSGIHTYRPAQRPSPVQQNMDGDCIATID